MRRRTLALVSAIALGLFVFAAPGATAAPRSARDGTATLVAGMTGAKEVPGPGDSDGRGRAVIHLDGDDVCFDLTWSNLSTPLKAHIHAGPAGVAGPIAVTLFDASATGGLPPTLSQVSGCIDDVDPALVAAIIAHPRNYYVNIHTTEFPGGAIRGQLHHGKVPGEHEFFLDALLNGANEVPGPGDPDGSGTAEFDPHGTTVCFKLTWANIDTVTRAHIHAGPAGVAGPIVVDLVEGTIPSTVSDAGGCITGVDPTLVSALRHHAKQYYANIHTVLFPGGAIRGQLHH